MSSCRRRSDESVNKRLVCKPRRRPPSSCQQRSDESLTASCVQATTLNKSLVCKLRRSTSSFQRCSDESENQRLRCASHDDADGLWVPACNAVTRVKTSVWCASYDGPRVPVSSAVTRVKTSVVCANHDDARDADGLRVPARNAVMRVKQASCV